MQGETGTSIRKQAVNMQFERPDTLRPSSVWKGYGLPLNRSCANSTCTCWAWYGSKLQLRDIDDVRKEIDALALFMEDGVHSPAIPDIAYAIARQWNGKRVFLQDGDDRV